MGTTVHQGPGGTPSHPGAPLPGGSSSVTKLCPAFVTPCTVACQAPLSVGFSGQEYWSGLPFPSPGDLPNPGIEPRFPALQADSLLTKLPGCEQSTGLSTQLANTE